MIASAGVLEGVPVLGDGAIHSVVVTWRPGAQQLTIDVDGRRVIRCTVTPADIAGVSLPGGAVYAGFVGYPGSQASLLTSGFFSREGAAMLTRASHP